MSAVPLCSPALLDGMHPLRAPADLRHNGLLQDDTPYEGRPEWNAWLKAAGVALSIKLLAGDDLAAGWPVVPFDLSLPVESACFLITLEKRAGNRQIEATALKKIQQAEEKGSLREFLG